MKKKSSFITILVSLLLSGFAFGAGGTLPGSGTEEDPYLIEDLADFDTFADPCNSSTYWASNIHTKLMCDLNLFGRSYTMAVIAFDPGIPNEDIFDGTAFSGIFDGNGHVISNLSIDPGGVDNWFIGLFGYISSSGHVKNLGVARANIIGGDYLGSICGMNDGGIIENCYATCSTISGHERIGGLVGLSDHGLIHNCYVFATGQSIFGYGGEVGGLVGTNREGTITQCYSTTDVNGGNDEGVGGLVGVNKGEISECFATGTIDGVIDVAGLVGYNFGTIVDCYATGEVSATCCYSAGLVSGNRGTITRCYSTGRVDGPGLVSYDYGSISACFWDTDSSGTTDGVGNIDPDPVDVMGRTTGQMQDPNTFISAGWDFVGETVNGPNDIWKFIRPNQDYPRLSWQPEIVGDFVGLYGVNLVDFAFFADRWLDDECELSNDCYGADLDLSTIVDIGDALILAEHWLEGL